MKIAHTHAMSASGSTTTGGMPHGKTVGQSSRERDLQPRTSTSKSSSVTSSQHQELKSHPEKPKEQQKQQQQQPAQAQPQGFDRERVVAWWKKKQEKLEHEVRHAKNMKECLEALKRYLVVDVPGLNGKQGVSLLDEVAQYEQKSPEWLLARTHRLTGSGTGDATGNNPYQSQNEGLRKMLWGWDPDERAKVAMAHGETYEPMALTVYFLARNGILPQTRYGTEPTGEQMFKVDGGEYEFIRPFVEKKTAGVQYDYIQDMTTTGIVPPDFIDFLCEKWPHYREKLSKVQQIKVAHSGLIICPEKPQFGTSPDGDVYERDDQKVPFLLEIKCPFKNAIYPEIPPQYKSQIQAAMGLRGISCCDFVIYCHHTTTITRYQFDPKYFSDLIQKMETFYWERYAKALMFKIRNQMNSATKSIFRCFQFTTDELRIPKNQWYLTQHMQRKIMSRSKSMEKIGALSSSAPNSKGTQDKSGVCLIDESDDEDDENEEPYDEDGDGGGNPGRDGFDDGIGYGERPVFIEHAKDEIHYGFFP